MIKGLYAVASAMIAGVNKQSLKAHNIANLNTPGFKQVFTTLQEFQRTGINPPGLDLSPTLQRSLGEIGLGVMTTDVKTRFSNGSIQLTNQPFDFAIQGDGFFRILTSTGERYTRNGNFTLDAEKQMVTQEGYYVLDKSGKSIQISNGEVTVDRSGRIFAGNGLVAELGLAEFNDPATQLQRETGGIFKSLAAPNPEPINTFIHQGNLEMSNVNTVDMMISYGTYEAAQKSVQIQDDLLGKSIQTLGKFT